jgi:hypothetical protein
MAGWRQQLAAESVKLILSRKGFDSSVGGHPSPILPDGTMLSLPIPSRFDTTKYDDLSGPGENSYGDIIRQLGIGGGTDGKGAHLDPDLLHNVRPRRAGWRPALGQIDAAAGHLRNQGVKSGDLFLFYGWFRPTEEINGKLGFIPSRSGFHAIYGYLEADLVLRAPAYEMLPHWLLDHPHAVPRRLSKSTNTIYVAAPRLTGHPSLPGSGVFRFDERLVLTQAGMSRSRWNLEPGLFQHLTISYHRTDAWRDGYFQSYPRAQEYVIDADETATRWATNLISSSSRAE